VIFFHYGDFVLRREFRGHGPSAAVVKSCTSTK
jgi:hypothetical protein